MRDRMWFAESLFCLLPGLVDRDWRWGLHFRGKPAPAWLARTLAR